MLPNGWKQALAGKTFTMGTTTANEEAVSMNAK